MGGEPVWVARRAAAAVARRARPRRQPPRHPRRQRRRPAARRRASTTRPPCSARCSAPPSTARCARGDAALTGPVARGDAGTVRAHLDALPADVRPAYVAMARLTADRALASGRLDADAGRRPARRPRRSVPRVRVGRRPARSCAQARAALPGRVAVVMTMGALHEGHAELVRQARAQADSVVVTVFVNPLQFGAGEDLDRYPRTLDADLAVCAREGADARLHAHARRRLPRRGRRHASAPDALGEVLRGRRAARPLRRHAHRRAQAAAPGAPGRRPVRAEGRAAARLHPPHGARPRRAGRGRRRPDGPRARRPGAVEPQPLPVGRGALAPRSPCRAPSPPATARPLDAEPGVDPDYFERVDSGTFEARPGRRPARRRRPGRHAPACSTTASSRGA